MSITALHQAARKKGLSLPVEKQLESVDAKVHIRKLPWGERSQYQLSAVGADGKIDFSKVTETQRRLAMKCVVNADGVAQVTKENIHEIEAVDGLMDELLKICAEVNGFGVKAVEEAGNGSDQIPND